jgi:hypothetical protein
MMRSRKVLLAIATAPVALYIVLFLETAAHLRDFKLSIDLSKGYALALTGQLAGEEWHDLAAATKLAFRSPTAEAKQALRSGHDRLVGVAGFGLFFPGIPDSFRNVVTDEKDLAADILGVGDTSSNRMSQVYQAASYRFAFLYNETVWPTLAQTFPGPALGIAPTRDGEAYYCDVAIHSGSAPLPGTQVALLRLSLDHRFDLLEGSIGNSTGRSDVLLEEPYARVIGRAERDGHNVVVRYVRESRQTSGAVLKQRAKALLRNEGGHLLFEGRVLTPCQWLDSAHFYVTFCKF